MFVHTVTIYEITMTVSNIEHGLSGYFLLPTINTTGVNKSMKRKLCMYV